MRLEHADLMRRMTAVDTYATELEAATTPADRLRTMRQIIDYFEGYLLPHATVEDHVLYAVADRKVGGPRSFTGVLRYEHRVIARWVADLSVLVRMSAPGPADARMFARRTDALLGLVRGHFESEEEVVFGMLDAVMSAEEFERDVMAKTR